jgi:hypothetical protein
MNGKATKFLCSHNYPVRTECDDVDSQELCLE